jgi:hypothetical protein
MGDNTVNVANKQHTCSVTYSYLLYLCFKTIGEIKSSKTKYELINTKRFFYNNCLGYLDSKIEIDQELQLTLSKVLILCETQVGDNSVKKQELVNNLEQLKKLLLTQLN